MSKLKAGVMPSPVIDSRKFKIEYIQKTYDDGGITCGLKWADGKDYYGDWIIVPDYQVSEGKQYLYNLYFDWVKARRSL